MKKERVGIVLGLSVLPREFGPIHIPGNPWFICTLWLAQGYIAKAGTFEELREAVPILEWIVSRALPSGVLAEQVHPFTNQLLSVSPLTWSHAAFVTAVLEYTNKAGEVDLSPDRENPAEGYGIEGDEKHTVK